VIPKDFNSLKKITAIGEIIFDVYLDIKKLGGAPLNFIYHIHKLTNNGAFISRVGDDAAGNEAISFLQNNNIPVDLIQIDRENETGAAYANLDENKIPHWDIPSDQAYDFISIPPEEEQIIESTSCFYFGSLAQRMERSRITIQSFFGGDAIYFLDLNIRQNYYTKNIISRSLSAANILKVNEEEINLLHNMFFIGNFNIAECAKKIMENFRIDLLAVTMGNKGAYLFNKNNSDFFRVKVDEISDTVGAGDAYSAILALGYLKNWQLNKINKLASEFAGEIIKIPGALPSDDLIYEKFRQY
jgi:fructokinase